MKYSPIARRNARCLITQALYQWQMSEDADDTLSQFKDKIDKTTDELYFYDVFRGVVNNIKEIDELIKDKAKNEIDKVTQIELSVLRMAIYELLYLKGIPPKVIINEAIEVDKIFGMEGGFKYINHILDSICLERKTDSTK